MAPGPTPAPPERPELPAGVTGRPRWPAWLGMLGFAIGPGPLLLLAALAALSGATAEAGAREAEISATFVVVATLVQGGWFVGIALLLASRIERPRAWHFGLRGTELGPALGWAALGMLVFYVVTALYGSYIQPDAEQGTVEALGGDQGTLGLIVAGAMVIAVAPVVEEVFFRGFLYGALRSRLGVWLAAGINGALFGVIHYSFESAEGLLLIPPLALLGFLFCLVYERTGSLLPVIGMHAFNNTVAYAAQADGGWQVSVVAGPLVLLACVLAPRLLPRAPRPLPA